jgi:hypothetical protein
VAADRRGLSKGKRTGRIRKPSQAKPVRLNAQPEQPSLTVERLAFRRDLKLADLLRIQNGVARQTCVQATPEQLERLTERTNRQDLYWFR